MTATRALVHIDALKHNIAFVRETACEPRFVLAPVKADAYGHGAVEISRVVLQNGVTHLGVARVSEALELRANKIDSAVLLFSHCCPAEIEDAVLNDISFFVSDIPYIKEILNKAEKLNKKVSVFLKIDTGMGRLGASPIDALEAARFIAAQKNLILSGICTHLSVSDSLSKTNIDYTKQQLNIFNQAVSAIKDAGLNPGIVSAAASGGVLQYPESRFDMVRAGILLYGYPPDKSLAQKAKVKPVMELVTKVVFIKKVSKGAFISYGKTWEAHRDTVIAALPVGYADGLPRIASGKLNFFIRGKLYPQVGRICMDQCMVDLGQNPKVELWDDAVIFGGEGSADAQDLADAAGTIPYEILTGIAKRVPRVYN